MTVAQAGSATRIGYIQAGVPRVVSGGMAGAPIVVTGGQQQIDTLTDVEATNAPTDSVLVKGADGIWRPRAYASQRGSVITFVDEEPTSIPADARPGDFYVAIEDGAAIYEVQET